MSSGIFMLPHLCSLWSDSKRVVNFPWSSLQRRCENYFLNFGVSLRETNSQKKKSSFEKHCVINLECRILSQEPSDSCILYSNIILEYKVSFMESKLKEHVSNDSWWRVNAVIIETVEAFETRYSISLSGSNVIFNNNQFVLVISHDTVGKQ